VRGAAPLVLAMTLIGGGPIVLALAFSSGDAPPEVRFSPRGGCTELVVREVGSAKKSVHVLAYSFTSAPIGDALLAAHRRGVDVSVVLDAGERHAPRCQGPRLGAAGVMVAYDAKHSIMHDKVVLVDDGEVLTGSFNFTASAEHSNAENLLLLRDSDLARRYAAEFDLHRAHAAP
jgi:phosphatidylserine/phosphatidylglycerophosphate/cardiolipin synthase-like enzyme